MVNFNRILKTSLTLFIYKVNKATTEDLSKNTTLTDCVIVQALQATGGDMCFDYVTARMKLKLIGRQRKLQLA